MVTSASLTSSTDLRSEGVHVSVWRPYIVSQAVFDDRLGVCIGGGKIESYSVLYNPIHALTRTLVDDRYLKWSIQVDPRLSSALSVVLNKMPVFHMHRVGLKIPHSGFYGILLDEEQQCCQETDSYYARNKDRQALRVGKPGEDREHRYDKQIAETGQVPG
jgi:hypothetical protein